MNKRQFKRLLRNYRQGKLDKARRRQVDEWFDSFGYEIAIEPLHDEEKVSRIHRELTSKLEAYTQSPKPVKRLYSWLPQVAAAALVAVLSAWWIWRLQEQRVNPVELSVYQRLSYDTVRTEAGRMKRIALPDQSVIWLNANTQLHYSKQTFERHRELFIDHGEAFFEVTKDPENPFVVHSEGMSTIVLGTSFNVKNYPELDYVSVQVKTGKVSVSVQDDGLQDTVIAGHGLKYLKGEKTFEADDRFATEAGSWMEGRTLLDNATFAELALMMNNRFGVTLQTQLPEASRFRYTMTILQHTPLDETMRLICDVHQTNYRRQGNEITIY